MGLLIIYTWGKISFDIVYHFHFGGWTNFKVEVLILARSFIFTFPFNLNDNNKGYHI